MTLKNVLLSLQNAANGSLSKKDFKYRIKICRKETKESCLWLRLSNTNNSIELDKEKQKLNKEAIYL